MFDKIKRFFKTIAEFIWGKFKSKEEVRKFMSLALIFFFIIGVYWILRSIKDSIFNVTVGIEMIPYAKILSVVFVFPIIMFYMKIVEIFKRERVFYTMMILYAIGALVFMFAFMRYDLSTIKASTSNYVGWLWYFYVESFGSVITASFWIILTDITLPDAAKRGFPVVYIFAQLGQVFFPRLVNAKFLGFATSAPIAGICALIMILIAIMLWIFMKYTPKSQLARYVAKGTIEDEKAEGKVEKAEVIVEDEPKKKKKKVGFIEGIKAIASSGYLMGILFVVMVFEVIVTVFDFQFIFMAAKAFPLEVDMSAYMSSFSSTVGIVTFIFAAFGLSTIQRKLGLFVSLLLTPILVLFCIFVLWTYPVLSIAFWIMVVSKAINYAINQPTLKNLYIPVKKETRYKTMGWIEAFGGRSSKSVGSLINLLGKFFKSKHGAAGVAVFLNVSSPISLGLVGIWFFVTFYLAKTNKKAVENNEYVC